MAITKRNSYKVTKKVSAAKKRKSVAAKKRASAAKKRASAAKKRASAAKKRKSAAKKRASAAKKRKSAPKKTVGTPAQSAMSFPEGTKRQGRNGHMYKTVSNASGSKLAWKKCNGKSVVCPSHSIQGPQRM
jgi:ATPase subunit of ABC transporter with duplicated ATPase domains